MKNVFSWLIIVALGMGDCDRCLCENTPVINGTAEWVAYQNLAEHRIIIHSRNSSNSYYVSQWPVCVAIGRPNYWFCIHVSKHFEGCVIYILQDISLSINSVSSSFHSLTNTSDSNKIHQTVLNERTLLKAFVRYLLILGDLQLKTVIQINSYILQEHFAFIGLIFIFNHFSLSNCFHCITIILILNSLIVTFENKLLSLKTNVVHILHSLLYRSSCYSYDIMYIIVYHNQCKAIFMSNQYNFFKFLNNENPEVSSCDDYRCDELGDSKNVPVVIDCNSATVRTSDDINFVDKSNDSKSADIEYTDSCIVSSNENEANASPYSNTTENIDCLNENDHKESSNDYIDRLNDKDNISSSTNKDDSDSSSDEHQQDSLCVTDTVQQAETCKISLTDHQNFSNSHCCENSTELASVMSSRRLVCNIIENPDVDLKMENESQTDLKSDSADDELKKILRQNISLQNFDKTSFQQTLTVLPVNDDTKQKTDSTKRTRRSQRQREPCLATERRNSANDSTSFECTDQVRSQPTNDRSHNDNLTLSNERGHSNIANAHENVSGVENAVNVFSSVDAKQGSDSCQEYAVKWHHKHKRRNRRRKTKVPSNDEADSAPLLRACNEIPDAPPVEKPRPNSSKMKCYELQSAVQETKPDQAGLSELGACGGDPLSVGYGTEETQIADAETEVDGVGVTAQESSQNQATRHSSRTTTQTPPEETTHLQNGRHDVFPDPAVDDSDLQRFESMMDIIDKIAVGVRVAPQITMRYEMLRLCTLRSFPKENKPFIIRIAQAGFYYANSGDEVVCYCCAKRKSGWRETDVPLEVHRHLSPNCRFLMSNSEVNVSVRRQEILASRQSVSATRVTSAADDTETNATPESHIIQSTYSDPHQNSTREFFRRSSAQFGNATTNDNSSSVAAPVPPSTLLQPNSTSTTGLTSTANTMNTNRPTAQYNNKATPVRSPKYPAYVTLATRQASFRDCRELAVPADTLAEAGFFYAGFGDCCRCFQCGVGLRHWSAEDDAWIEHSRWSRNCSYVREKKGEEFTNLVQMAVEYQQNQERSQEPQQSTASGSDERPGSGNRNVDSLLHSDAAQSVLEMGYTPEMIRRAIQIVLNNVSLESIITAALLMEQIFAMEESELSQATDPLTPTAQLSPSPVPAPQVSTSVALPPQLPATLAPTSTLARAPQASEPLALIPEATPTQAETSMTSATKPRDHTARNQNNDEVTSPEVEGATAASSRNATRKMPSLEQKKLREENARMKQQTICTKCKQNDVSIVFLPCGHLVTCEACAETVRYCTERNCGKYIKGTVRTYAA